MSLAALNSMFITTYSWLPLVIPLMVLWKLRQERCYLFLTVDLLTKVAQIEKSEGRVWHGLPTQKRSCFLRCLSLKSSWWIRFFFPPDQWFPTFFTLWASSGAGWEWGAAGPGDVGAGSERVSEGWATAAGSWLKLVPQPRNQPFVAQYWVGTSALDYRFQKQPYYERYKKMLKSPTMLNFSTYSSFIFYCFKSREEGQGNNLVLTTPSLKLTDYFCCHWEACACSLRFLMSLCPSLQQWTGLGKL